MADTGQLILLIEPDEAVREAISSLIRQHGWQIDAFPEAGELKELLNDRDPVALIVESALPDMSAKKVLKTSSRASVPVIFLGHKREVQDAVDLMRLGAKDFLEKPFPQDRLLRILDSLTVQSPS